MLKFQKKYNFLPFTAWMKSKQSFYSGYSGVWMRWFQMACTCRQNNHTDTYRNNSSHGGILPGNATNAVWKRVITVEIIAFLYMLPEAEDRPIILDKRHNDPSFLWHHHSDSLSTSHTHLGYTCTDIVYFQRVLFQAARGDLTLTHVVKLQWLIQWHWAWAC